MQSLVINIDGISYSYECHTVERLTDILISTAANIVGSPAKIMNVEVL